jgi:two-component system response regulator MprA
LLAFADLTLDVESGVGRRAGRDLELTRREAELLELLLRNPRGVVTRDIALERVWGGEGEASLNVVDRYVAYLRRKLDDPPLIHTVRGIGFRLDT